MNVALARKKWLYLGLLTGILYSLRNVHEEKIIEEILFQT